MNDKLIAGQNPENDQGKSTWLRRMLQDSLSVQSKFFLVTGLILLLNCLGTALIIYKAEKRQLVERAFGQSELVMAAVEASRAYVREELRPVMYRRFGPDIFLPEAMSTSYVGRSVMERFAPLVDDYDYRRVAINARNPHYEAGELERRMIAYFVEHPEQTEWRGLLQVNGKDKFKRFRPVYFEEECLLCHGRPEHAPPGLIEIYGDRLGFGRTAGELAGLVAVGVPVAATLVEARQKATLIFVVVAGGLALVLLALNFFFHHMVVTNLRGILEIFRDQEELPQGVKEQIVADPGQKRKFFQHQDELAELTAAAHSMAASLRQKKEQLHRYNQELEQRVEERTSALQKSEQALREARDNLEVRVRQRTAELEQANVELEESRRRIEMAHRDWNDAFDAIQDPIFIHDRNHRIVHANPAYVQRAGLPLEELRGRTYYEIFPKLSQPLPSCRDFPEKLAQESGDEVTLPQGEVLVSRSFGIRRADGSYRHSIHILEDLTELRRFALELQRLNRSLRTISRGNEALVRVTDELELLNEICQILVETGGYQMAWVGYAEADPAQTVKPMAYAGREDGFLQAVPTTWADEPHGRGPTGAAIVRRQAVASRDLQNDTDFAPWRDEALERGYASVIALPLFDGDELYGALSIYAAEPNAFDTHEVVLLSELADDLAFGIHMLRIRAEREAAVRDLAASEARFQELFEHAPAGYLLLRLHDGTIIQVNEAAIRMLGYQRGELVDRSLFALFPPGVNGLARAESLFGLFSQGEQLRDQELQVRRKNGETIWISLTAQPVFDKAGRIVECRASILDISKRKEAEQGRQQLTERLQRSLVQTIQAIATTIEKRDPYTAGHQQRVAELAVAIAQEMGLDEQRIEGLRLGAMIHDIGKIYVPAELLNRPGELDELEFRFIRTHPEVGHEIIKGVDFPWPVAEMVVQHHEWLDGSGYPNNLRGDEIVLEARIIAVADVVEAITNHRPYRPALQLEKAIQEIREHEGRRYDPAVVAACVRLFQEKGFQWSKVWGAGPAG
ncbi:HD domain-containing phosphohydrolase [Desulfurivibrio alkaliphilus]|uniref:Putative PAS/PAC sensor protein n=1 Tax=Desulfurivibrio alkaliphilus (strain DSM 19089 / UNIQEM U267 / AHT2) TaxID=589865 RepID=D6Z741_DESAT|nr:HD domain-containing phosphohydrolase [Desulfurivibrio alkaliphilus]ADH87028.1 putative PAS/PAC sensor protein [Desulfurivibrio alkaliphilus AHT 2]